MDLFIDYLKSVDNNSFSRQVSPVSDENLLEAVYCLKENNIAHIIEEWFFEILQHDLRQRVSPAFWSHFNNNTPDHHKHTAQPHSVCTDNDDVRIMRFCQAFDELHEYLSAFFPSLNIVESLRSYTGGDAVRTLPVKDQAQVVFKAVLFFCPPKHFHETVQEFYSQAFKVFHHTTEDFSGMYSTLIWITTFIRSMKLVLNLT